MSEFEVIAEASPSGRASCQSRGCGEKIGKGEFRVTQKAEGARFPIVKHYHVQCYELPKGIADLDELEIKWDLVGDNKQEALRRLREAIAEKKSEKIGKKKIKAKKPRKIEDISCIETSDDDDKQEEAAVSLPVRKKRNVVKKSSRANGVSVQITRQPKSAELAEESLEESAQYGKLFKKYNGMIISDLKDYLRANNQALTGKKSELVFRCLEGERNGRLLPCSSCGKGKLAFDDRNMIVCRGYWDEEINMRIPCSFTCLPEEVKREKWLEPGESIDAVESNEATGNETISANTMEKVRSAIDALGEDPLPKDVAEALCAVGKETGLNLPKNDQAAKMRCATTMMEHKSEEDGRYDFLAIYKHLHAELGSKAAAAKVEQQKALNRPRARIEANNDIADMIDELGSLESEAAEGANFMFKVRALRQSASAIRNCDFKILSGKQVSSGKMKLPGVGKGTGEKIQEFIDTGEISRLVELREQFR